MAAEVGALKETNARSLARSLAVLCGVLMIRGAAAQAVVDYTLSDRFTRLCWWVEVTTPTGVPVSAGNYVMGEPWIALAPGQTAKVRQVRRWLTLPTNLAALGQPGTQATGTIDAAYVGPVLPGTRFGGGSIPADGGYRDGVQLNPLGGQVFFPGGSVNRSLGLDSRVGGNSLGLPGFDPTLFKQINEPGYQGAPGIVGLPLSAGDAIVATVSNAEQPCGNCGASNSWVDIWSTLNGNPCQVPLSGFQGAECSRCPTQFAACMSVLSAAPPAQSFRKPYAMLPADRLALSHLTVGSVRWQELPRLAWPTQQPFNPLGPCIVPSSLSGCWPDPSMLAPFFRGMWLDHWSGEFAAEQVNPTMHIPGYGQRGKRVIHTAALLTCLNPDGYAAGTPSIASPSNTYGFLDMTYGILQAGIDVYGLVRDPSHSFQGGGGRVGGRKFMVAFAAKMFGPNAYPGMDGSFVGTPPAGLPVPPKWTAWEPDPAVPGSYLVMERFQEDVQFFGTVSPLEANPSLRVDWEWTGSPWKWGSAIGGLWYQSTAPSAWPAGVVNPNGPQWKMGGSVPCHAPAALAVRLLGMESIWQNTGLLNHKRSLAGLPPLTTEPLHPMLAFIDRVMMTVNEDVRQDYVTAVGTPIPHRDGLGSEADEFNFGFPFRQYSPKFTTALYDQYRAALSSPTGVAMIPMNWVFNGVVNGCSQLAAPNMLCHFPPREGKQILVELYKAKHYESVPAGPGSAWLSLYLTSLPIPPYQFSLGGNSVTLYVDPGAVLLSLQPEGAHGATSEVVTVPAGAATIGQTFVMQSLLTDFGSGGTGCIAASNALFLTIQP